MAMRAIYKGGFYSVGGTLYEVEILKEGHAGATTEIAFGEDPLTIEWADVDKLEPVMSSSARIQLFSDSDRQFVGLYTVETGSVRMDLYRDGALYWSGTIDTELYEEPYAYKDGYVVEITFSDFAPLDRLRFNGGGFMTLRSLINAILNESGVRYTELIPYISTAPYLYNVVDETSGSLLDTVSVQAANFYDEDGEAMSLREVLDETLRPLSLRLLQKDGHIYLYDLNALSTAVQPALIAWESDDATLSVDKVYNNVKISFSPYERTSLISDGMESEDVPDENRRTVYVNKNEGGDNIGFHIYESETGSAGIEKHASAKFFKIDSVYSGSDAAGILWSANPYTNLINTPCPSTGAMLFKPVATTYVGDVAGRSEKIKISLSLCVDTRYNPFEEASDDNNKKEYENLQNWANFAYAPVKILLKDAEGNVLYHFFNNGVKLSNSFGHGEGKYKWMAGDTDFTHCWLCYYQGNRKSESGLGGWQTNKPIIGYYRGEKLPVNFDKLGTGEYIPLPPVAGFLEVQVGVGVNCYDYDSDTSWKLRTDLYPYVKWMLYKDLKVELVDKYGKTIDRQDVEISAWVNRSAKEELSLDTKLGTLDKASPTALGQYFATSNYAALSRFRRAGVTDRLEKLLCGTVYSNYRDRHATLSGTVSVLHQFGTYMEANEAGTFVLAHETQNLRMDTSEITMTRFDADNYEGIAYE